MFFAPIEEKTRMDSKITYTNQRLELVSMCDVFIKDVRKFRKNWKISIQTSKRKPKNTVGSYDYVQYERKIIDLYKNGDAYKNKVLEIRNYNNSLSKDIAIAEYGQIPLAMTLYQEEINALLKKYNLNKRYENPLKVFIYENRLCNCNSVLISESIDEFLGQINPEVLEISVYPDTKISDIQNIWPEIEEWQEKIKTNKLGKYTPMRSYDLIKRLWGLYNDKKSIKEMATVVFNEFEKIWVGEIKGMIDRYEYRKSNPNECGGAEISHDVIREYIKRAKKLVFEKDFPEEGYMSSHNKKRVN